MLSRTQVEPGRTVKQELEEISAVLTLILLPVLLVEAEVGGEEESGGGGVEGDVGVEGRAVAVLHVDLVTQQDAVPVLQGQ